MAYFAPQIRSRFEYQQLIPPFVPNFHAAHNFSYGNDVHNYSYYAAPQVITFLDQERNVFRVPSRTRSTTEIEYYRGSSLNDETIIWNEFDYVAHLRSNSSTEANSSHRPRQTVLSEETIVQHLKTRNCVSVKLANDNDEEPEICVVCQGEYEENERVGILRCGHEYHVDCITTWLLQKNVCPICKAEALPMEHKK
ncbi:Uncharacterized protein Adt_46802 [Abeliophyllum distichum]|uniref:RING-type E3 ubiquitin transferase n=1 Tax=Abeliophyllum distichum TaxID=126358 RepID=A0ABD1NXT0_9LAMI